MPTYEEVLSLAKRLSRDDRARLLTALAAMMANPPSSELQAVVVEGTDEVVSAAEIAESEAALQDYYAGRDRGITATALKQQLFGGDGG